MSVQRYRAIETPIGVLQGRTAVALADVDFKYDQATITLRGRIDGYHASRATDEWYLFELAFHGVIALKMIELDSWFDMGLSQVSISQFDEVIDSEWRAELRGKVKPEHRHFSVVTYDDAIDVICESYELAVGAIIE